MAATNTNMDDKRTPDEKKFFELIEKGSLSYCFKMNSFIDQD